MNFSLTSCNTPQSSGAWKVMKWDFFKEQMNERWRLSGPKVRWGHCQGPDFGVREGQGCSGVRRNTKGCWRLITHLCFMFQPMGSPLCKQMLRLWDCGMPWGIGATSAWVVQLCCVLVFFFFSDTQSSTEALDVGQSTSNMLRLGMPWLPNVLPCFAELFVEVPRVLRTPGLGPNLLGSCCYPGAFWDFCFFGFF